MRSAFDVFKQTLNSLFIICFYSLSVVCPKYILDTAQNSVKVSYLKGFKKQSAKKPLRHISNSLCELCL